MTDCLLKLDWEKIWKEFDIGVDNLVPTVRNKYVITIEDIVNNNINKAIEELVEKHTSNNIID